MIRQFNGLSQENRLFFVLARIGAYTGAHPETPGGKGRQAKGGEGERDDEAKGGTRREGAPKATPNPRGGNPQGPRREQNRMQGKSTIGEIREALKPPHNRISCKTLQVSHEQKPCHNNQETTQ